MRTLVAPLAALFVVLIDAGCSGGTSTPVVPVAKPKAVQSAPATTSSAKIKVIVPRYGPAVAGHRRPNYVSPSTQSIGFVVSPGSAAPQSPLYVDIASASCTQNTVAITCNADVPIYATSISQNVAIEVTTYDGPDGSGNVLSSGSAMATIEPGTANAISLSLSGKVSSLVAFFVEPLANVPSTGGETLFVVQALDADGNVIVSSTGEPLDRPITITSADTTGDVEIIQGGSNPTPSLTLSNLAGLNEDGIPVYGFIAPTYMEPYPGLSGPTVFTVSAPGVASVTATLLLAPLSIPSSTAVTQVQYPWQYQSEIGYENLAPSTNGAIWAVGENSQNGSSGFFVKAASNGAQTITAVPQNDLVITTAAGASGDEWALAQISEQYDSSGNLPSKTGAGLLHLDTNGNLTTIPIVDPANAPPTLTQIAFNGVVEYGSQAFSPAALFASNGITVAPDGSVWFTDSANGALWHYSGGAFSVYTIPGPSYGANGANAMSVVVHPNGNVYFVEEEARAIGVFNPKTSAFSQIALPYYGSGYTNLVVGADGNLWLAQNGPGQLYRINASTGAVNAYTIGFDYIGEIGVASDGIWMSTQDPKLVGTSISAIKSTYGGAFRFYALGTYAIVNSLTVGSDGRVWLDGIGPTGTFNVFTP